MARWAVLGASSFSGAAFVKYLTVAGESVAGYSRPQYDLNTSLDALMEQLEAQAPAYVVNFIALNMVGESWRHWEDYFRTNVIATARLHEALRDSSSRALRASRWLKKYVHVSTPEVYGSTGSSLKEGAPFNPSTPYAVSRAATDLNLAAYHRAQGFPVAFTRSVNVYGPGQQLFRIIPKTILAVLAGRKIVLHGGGVSTRSFIHIDDVCEATLRVARAGRPGETYHTSTMRQTSIRGLVMLVCDMMGARFEDVVTEGDERLGKDMNYQLDSSRIRSELGWSDRVPLEEGLAETIDWYKKRPWLKDQPSEYEHKA